MKKTTQKNSAMVLAPLLLFVIFTTCILGVLLTGVSIYKTLNNRNQTNFEHRTIAQYLTTRLRQSDVAAMSFVGDFYECIPSSDGDTLFICEEINNNKYYTRIYCHDGYLYELFTTTDGKFYPQDGEKLLELKDLHFFLDSNLLEITVTYKDTTVETLIINLHVGKEFSGEK